MKSSVGVSNSRMKSGNNQIVSNISFTREEYLIVILILLLTDM